MSQPSLVFDANESDFEERVLRASAERAVVVDFWAPWCGPCRMLGPVLERVVESAGGALALAKVNVDENQALAARYGVQSIPAVKVFVNGQVATEFVGALPEEEVRRILSAAAPSDADKLVAQGDQLAAEGKTDEAEAAYRDALAKDPRHAAASLRLARIALDKGDAAEAKRLAEAAKADAREDAEAILARIEFLETCEQAGGLEAAQAAADAAADDPDKLYALGCCLAARGRYEDALETLLRSVQLDKDHRDAAAKKAMVQIFSLVGPKSDLANEYRSRLASALY